MRGRGRKRLPEGHERLSAQPAERSYRRGDDFLGERLHVMLKLRHALLGHVAAGALYGDGQRRHIVFGFRVRRPHPRRPLEPSIHVLAQESLELPSERDQIRVCRCRRSPRFEGLEGRADALYVVSEPLMASSRVRINTLALGARLPTLHGLREYVEAGGLMSYGPNVLNQFRRTADYVDKILRGANPGDMPVEQPTKFDLVINLTTAKTLRLEVSAKLLTLADEVIE
jgi:hypothetical protein